MFSTLLLASSLVAGETPPPKLSGGFIQYQDATKALSKYDWERVCQAMLDIGCEKIILQQTEYEEGGKVTSFIPFVGQKMVDRKEEKDSVDPTEIILAFADSKKMKVYVGLRFTKEWDTIRMNEGDRERHLCANKCLASFIGKRYGHHQSFAGWYLPQELANYGYSHDELADLNKFFGKLSKHCTTVGKGKAVAISPYFNPCLADPKRFSSDIQKITEGSTIDIIMLQDSVGERQIAKIAIKEKVSPYFEEMKHICGKKRQLWANLESFQRQGQKRTPLRDFERFELQFGATQKYASDFVTFDFFHFMNPYGYAHEEKEYVEAEKALYEAYKKKFPKK